MRLIWLFQTMLFVVFGTFALVTFANTPFNFVYDEQEVLSQKTLQSLEHVLNASATYRNIHVRVVVLNIKDDEHTQKIIQQKWIAYKNKLPVQVKGKSSFLIINLATNKSIIFLAEAINQTEPMLQNVKNVQREMINPLLQRGEVEISLMQGAIALTTILDTAGHLQKTSFSWQSTKDWLIAHRLFFPLQLMGWGGLLTGLYWGLRRYLNRPAFMPEVDMKVLEEQMINNSLALRQQYHHSYFDRSY